MAYPSSYFPVGYQYYQPVMQQPQNIQQNQGSRRNQDPYQHFFLFF